MGYGRIATGLRPEYGISCLFARVIMEFKICNRVLSGRWRQKDEHG